MDRERAWTWENKAQTRITKIEDSTCATPCHQRGPVGMGGSAVAHARERGPHEKDRCCLSCSRSRIHTTPPSGTRRKEGTNFQGWEGRAVEWMTLKMRRGCVVAAKVGVRVYTSASALVDLRDGRMKEN